MFRLTAILLFCLLPGLAPLAQDVADDAAESARQEERDELEPAVPSAVLAADSGRRYTDNGVMDELELGRSEITGNQELPKVLYIVPWQKSDPGDLMGRPVNTLLNEVLAPVDRSEFVRQVDYYHRLNDDNRN
jgi:hypothetical protein